MIFAELLNRAAQAASGIEGAPISQTDRDMTAETIYPHAVRAVYREHARTGRHLENLTREYAIEIDVNDVGTLPDGILREYLDRSYLPNLPFASKVPWEDYARYQFNRQMAYYAIRNNEIKFSGNVIGRPSVTATNASSTITGDGSAAAIGDRFYLLDGSSILDATIATVTGAASFTIWGVPGYNFATSTEGILYRGQDDVVSRSFLLGTGTTNSTNLTFSSSNAAFVEADAGRRIRAYVSNAANPILDAKILSRSNATTVLVGCKALSTNTSSTLNIDIMYTPIVLQAIGIPDVPATLTDDLLLAPEVAEDVIVKIAQVLRNDIPLQALIEVSNGKR